MTDITGAYHSDRPNAIGKSLIIDGKWVITLYQDYFVGGTCPELTPRQALWLVDQRINDWYRTKNNLFQ